MRISCGLAPRPDIPDLVAHAERLGYHRAWLYDSPVIWGDVWAGLMRCAERTERIGLGTGVIVPRLRHVMTTAAAIAGVEQLAPGRLIVGVGSGFTGSRMLGQKAMKWAEVEAYVQALRDLLRGEAVDWEGGRLRMCHRSGYAAERPVEVPFVIAAEGPKGVGVAQRLGGGLFTATIDPPEGFDPQVRLVWGTVLDDGEGLDSPRVVETAGPDAALVLHASYELGGAEAVDALPGGAEWRAAIEQLPQDERHLAIHAGHMTELTELDRVALSPELMSAATITGTPSEVAAVVEQLAAIGINEVCFHVSGPDIPRELEAFMSAARAAAPA